MKTNDVLMVNYQHYYEGSMFRIISIVLSLILLTINILAQNPERKSLAVTIYNDELGVIRDTRVLQIAKGTSEIRLTDVSEKIDPTSVHIKFNGNILEQNYQYDLASMDKILKRYIDKKIRLIDSKGTTIEGTLMTSGYQIVLRLESGGLIMIPNLDSYRLYVDELPEGLITVPTLIWLVDSKKDGKQDVEVSYQTRGLSWQAEYVAVLNNNDTKMDFNSWVSISNYSGTSYPGANIKLVAGDINRVSEPQTFYESSYELKMARDGAAPMFEEKSFFEYHIYEMLRPTTLANNETKQISLFETSDVNINKKYYYKTGLSYSGRNTGKVSVVVEFENKTENNLGMPMPKGKVRLYKSDGKTLEFIGEDYIDHTAKNEILKLKVGDAFDIVVDETLLNEERISDKVYEYEYEIKLRNSKSEDIVIEVESNVYGNWQVLSSTFKHEKKDARTIVFKVPVKKSSESVLNYKIRYVY